MAKATANPTKTFFVQMITRDISLDDCILDLIDNSIDAAWALEGGRTMSLSDKGRLSKYKIEIDAYPDHFRIIDNCGGISLQDAEKYAFTFGRKIQDPHEKYSIGVYGIGMKRAVFKLGKKIKIKSTYKAGRDNSFLVPIDVPEWIKRGEDTNWDFEIKSEKPLPTKGVEIIVRELTEETAVAFGNPSFIQKLKRTIARDYALHLHRGLQIFVNNKEILGWEIQMRKGAGIAPMRIAYKDGQGGSAVNVEILAGMAVPPPESNDPDEDEEKESRSGWYVACNGRIVLAADKSVVSGWSSDDWPRWHPQYEGFVGLIHFASANAKLLPLTTTKRSVDIGSGVYRRAMPRMREVSKLWISYTNIRKQVIEVARKLEDKAKAISIFKVRMRKVASFPRLSPKPKKKVANILYSVTPTRARDLADALGDINLSYREIGLRSFDYTYNDLVGDN